MFGQNMHCLFDSAQGTIVHLVFHCGCFYVAGGVISGRLLTSPKSSGTRSDSQSSCRAQENDYILVRGSGDIPNISGNRVSVPSFRQYKHYTTLVLWISSKTYAQCPAGSDDFHALPQLSDCGYDRRVPPGTPFRCLRPWNPLF